MNVEVQVYAIIPSPSPIVTVPATPQQNQNPGAYRYSRSYMADFIRTLLNQRFGTGKPPPQKTPVVPAKNPQHPAGTPAHTDIPPPAVLTFDTLGTLRSLQLPADATATVNSNDRPGISQCLLHECIFLVFMCAWLPAGQCRVVLHTLLSSYVPLPTLGAMCVTHWSELLLWLLILILAALLTSGIRTAIRRIWHICMPRTLPLSRPLSQGKVRPNIFGRSNRQPKKHHKPHQTKSTAQEPVKLPDRMPWDT